MSTNLQGSTLQTLAMSLITLFAFVLPISVTATTCVYLLAALVVIIMLCAQQKLKLILTNPVAWTFWILFILYLAGLTYTHSTYALALQDLQKQHWMLLTPFFMLAISSDLWRNRMLNGFLLAMILTLILSYFKFWGFQPLSVIFPELKKLSPANVFFEQIVQNFFMSIAAFIVGYRLLFNRRWRWFNATLFLFMGVNILFLSLGRTGYITFLLLMVYLAWIRWSWKGLLSCALVGMLLVGCAYFGSARFHTRINQIATEYVSSAQNGRHTSVGQRVGMWENSWLLIERHPWIGYGTGGIRQPMQQNLTQAEIDRTGLLDYVEFSFLNLWLEFGIFGLMLFAFVIATQIYWSFRLETPYRHFLQGFLLAFLVGSLANSFFVSFCEAHLYALFATICFSTLNEYPLKRKLFIRSFNYG